MRLWRQRGMHITRWSCVFRGNMGRYSWQGEDFDCSFKGRNLVYVVPTSSIRRLLCAGLSFLSLLITATPPTLVLAGCLLRTISIILFLCGIIIFTKQV